MVQKKQRKGYTIIEVVLVLAIAGLIFTMVFVALPTMQRAQRNAQRKRDLAAIIAAITQWKTHNTGNISDDSNDTFKTNGFCTFWNRYIGEEIRDPDTGKPYKVALLGQPKTYDCEAKVAYDRNGYDTTISIHTSGNSWAKMELGDIQYGDGVYCNGDTFGDNSDVSSNARVFAIRTLLEGGAFACVDNGFSADPNDHN